MPNQARETFPGRLDQMEFSTDHTGKRVLIKNSTDSKKIGEYLLVGPEAVHPTLTKRQPGGTGQASCSGQGDPAVCMHSKLFQLHPTLCNPMNGSPPGSSVHGDSSDKNTGVACHACLHRIFLIHISNVSCIGR